MFSVCYQQGALSCPTFPHLPHQPLDNQPNCCTHSNVLHCTHIHLLGKPPPQFFSAYAGASLNSYRWLPHCSQPVARPSAIST